MIDNRYKAKVIDFGAARDYHTSEDKSVLLKHGYAPVEQYDRNGELGPWTDIYSLAATIYYLLSGIKIQRSIERQTNDQVQLLQVIGVPVTEEQDLAIKKALNIDKKDRFQTMAEFYQALYGEALPGEQKKPEAQKMQATQKTPEGQPNTGVPGEFGHKQKPVGNAIDVAQKYIAEHGEHTDGNSGING